MSRQHRPKFLLDLFGSGRSMLQSTVDRMRPLCDPERIFIVTGSAHEAAVSEQCPELAAADNILIEASPRDSMAAIGLAAAVIERRFGPTIVGSFAADHVISGSDEFFQAINQAVAVAREGYLVTIGMPATRPSTAFGYIRTGDRLDIADAPRARRVVAFKEKPDSHTAMEYLATGNYRWNAGMFVVSTDVLLGHLERLRPELHAALRTIAGVWGTDRQAEAMRELWPTLEKVSIDVALAEPVADAGGAAVISGSFGWDDVGDFNSLAALLPSADELGNKLLGMRESIVTEKVAGSIISASTGRTIAVLGLDDVVVIDTEDAVLVTTRARAQQVRQIVQSVTEIIPDPPV
ncbi:mannose-1-phosphate guanylyltransferase [Rarobacter faecitabidus]